MKEIPEGCDIVEGMLICENGKNKNSEEEYFTNANDNGTSISIEKNNNARDLNVC